MKWLDVKVMVVIGLLNVVLCAVLVASGSYGSAVLNAFAAWLLLKDAK